MTRLFSPHLVWVLLIPAAVSLIRLKSYPDVATQGEGFTLSCVNDYDLEEMRWLLNSDPVFKTKLASQVPVVTGNAPSYFVTSGRITVSTSSKEHNVTLRINSTLDDGTVWECDVGGILSNNLTIHVMQHTTVVSTSQTTTLQTVQTSTSTASSMDTTKGPDYIPLIAGIVAGAVIVVSVVIVTLLCVRRHRNIQKQDTTTTEIPVYSTMSRDYDTDNHYTQLDPRLNQSENEATLDTPSDVYYITVSEGRDSYENPPLHHSVDQKIK